MVKQNLRPGQTVKTSGQYIQIGPRGGVGKTESTLVQGKTTPPTSKPDCTYFLVDKTKHKR